MKKTLISIGMLFAIGFLTYAVKKFFLVEEWMMFCYFLPLGFLLAFIWPHDKKPWEFTGIANGVLGFLIALLGLLAGLWPIHLDNLIIKFVLAYFIVSCLVLYLTGWLLGALAICSLSKLLPGNLKKLT